MNDLYEAQMSHEDRVMAEARLRAKKLEHRHWRGDGADPEHTRTGISAISHYGMRLAEVIKAECDNHGGYSRGGRATKRKQDWIWLAQLDPKVVSVLTITFALRAMASERKAEQDVARKIGASLVDEAIYQRYHQQTPGHAYVVTKRIKQASSTKYQEAVLHNAIRSVDLDLEGAELSVESQVHLGARLLHLFSDLSGLYVIETKSTGGAGRKRKPRVVKLTPLGSDWMRRGMRQEIDLLRPIYEPMVVPPLPWSAESIQCGGYLKSADEATKHTQFGRHLSLVAGARPEILAELGARYMPHVYAALNAMQSVKWEINRPVLEVARRCAEEGRVIANMPSMDPLPMPARPALLDNPEHPDFEETLKAYKATKRDVHEAEAKAISHRMRAYTQLRVAEIYAEYPEIYFPHQLDFRGRAYPIPTALNPQSDPLGKGLLRFAEGKPLGEDGGYWLAVHIANLFGVDKDAFDDRVDWTLENSDKLVDSGLRPLDGEEFWLEADDPWGALAACMEWAGMMMSGDHKAYVSHLPVAMDGSCNGLQNFSAMLRDEVGGRATNLVPQDRPSDIYSEVLTVTRDRVERDVGDDKVGELALSWLQSGNLDRKVVKRPVMTRPYGAVAYGMTEQIQAELAKRGVERSTAHAHARYLAPLVFDAIGEVVVGAKVAMDWLQEVAAVCAEADQPVSWTTPIGYKAIQRYVKQRERVIELKAGLQRVRLFLKEDDGKKLNKRKQRNGIAPNFIHSMDSSHMMGTVLAMVDGGMDSLSMVHDSYATHACHISMMNVLLRQEFVDMYREDVLETFREEIVIQLPPEYADKIPPVPAKGSLDLEQVLESDYFFA